LHVQIPDRTESIQMSQVLDVPRPSLLARFFSRPYTLLGVVVLLILAVPVFKRQAQDWESVYVPAAERLIQGEDIYQEFFVYPPINAWMALPFVGLSHVPTRALWYVVNMIALSVLLVGAWKLSGGGRLQGSPSVPWREHAIFWLGVVCAISSCLDALTNQQTDLFVGALVILGCVALANGRDLRAAVWFGIAAGIKCTPLLWAPYLAWKKRWVAAMLVGVVAVGVNLLPELTHPSKLASTHASDWVARYLMPMADRDHEFGAWHCGIGGNQSVAGLWHRWLVYNPEWEGNNQVGVRKEVYAHPAALRFCAWGTIFLLLGAAVACSWKSSAQSWPAPTSQGVEFAMMVILMVLMSPHSSKPHFCILLLPAFCVARAALIGNDRRLLALLGVALIGAVVANMDLVGEWIYSWGKWFGSQAWCSILLYAGCCRLLLARREVAAGTVDAERPVDPPAVRQAA
jgi:hypothetical protein